MLNAFPAELLLRTANELDNPSLLNLSSVSHRFHSIIAPLTLRNVKVVVDGGRDFMGSVLAVDTQLATCNESLPHLYNYARHLRVHIATGGLLHAMSKGRFSPLFQTLSQFRSIKSLSLSWETGFQDTDELLQTLHVVVGRVVGCVLETTGGKLEKLYIQPPVKDDWFPSSLMTIRGLKVLQVVRDPNRQRCYGSMPREKEEWGGKYLFPCHCLGLPIVDLFGPLIAANPDLEQLELRTGCLQRAYNPDFLFESSLQSLTSLTFGGLTFTEVDSASMRRLDPFPLRNICHLVVHSFIYPFPADKLWNLLHHAQVPLQTLVTSQVSLPLLRYLSSFSGLRTLKIQDIHDLPESVSPEINSVFMKSVLPKHAGTLQHLSISFADDQDHIQGWEFNMVDWPAALAILHDLRTLAIHPPMPESLLRNNSPDPDKLLEAYQNIINTVEMMPKLEELTIIWPTLTYKRLSKVSKWYDRWWQLSAKVTRQVVGITGRPEVLNVLDGAYYAREEEVGGWKWEKVVDLG